MSPDRTTTTRAEALRRRKVDDQKKSERGAHRGGSKPRSVSTQTSGSRAEEPREAVSKPSVKTRRSVLGSTRGQGTSGSGTGSRLRNRYDIAMSTPIGRGRSTVQPKGAGRKLSINLPKLHPGPRLFSFFLVIFCALDMYVMFSMDPFVVRKEQVAGNERVSIEEIVSASGAIDQPAAFINPLQLEHNIRVAFPDIENVQVDVGLPGSVFVTVSERKPVAAWVNGEKITWVDAQGYGFQPRGEVAGLVTIKAKSDPAVPGAVEGQAVATPAPVIGARLFMDSELTNAIKTLSAYVPQGTVLVFDPEYGLGWSDPKGWDVYFGYSNGDADLKIRVYQSMIEYFSSNNLQPVLINVEFPNAPFYRLEQ